jgi:hypothetical protein
MSDISITYCERMEEGGEVCREGRVVGWVGWGEGGDGKV